MASRVKVTSGSSTKAVDNRANEAMLKQRVKEVHTHTYQHTKEHIWTKKTVMALFYPCDKLQIREGQVNNRHIWKIC